MERGSGDGRRSGTADVGFGAHRQEEKRGFNEARDDHQDQHVDGHPKCAHADQARLAERFHQVHFHADAADQDVNEYRAPAAGTDALQVAGGGKGKQQESSFLF